MAQILVNCHCQLENTWSHGDVKPMKLIMQYLTHAAVVKLSSASDDVHSSVQHTL